MESSALHLVQAFVTLANTPPSTSSPGGGFVQFVPLILLFVIFYFILIRPQQLRAKAHAKLLKDIKKNDKIVTSGGIIGVIVSVNDKTVSIRSGESKLEINKSAVSEFADAPAADKK